MNARSRGTIARDAIDFFKLFWISLILTDISSEPVLLFMSTLADLKADALIVRMTTNAVTMKDDFIILISWRISMQIETDQWRGKLGPVMIEDALSSIFLSSLLSS